MPNKLDILSQTIETNRVEHRSPIRPSCDTLTQMKSTDATRFNIYTNYSMLHEFSAKEVDKEATLQQKLDAREKDMTKLAKQIKHWPDTLKINAFAKYEKINIKTYKFKNKTNLSCMTNQEFDPNQIKEDPSALFQQKQ